MSEKLKPCPWCGESERTTSGPGLAITHAKGDDYWTLRHWCHELTTIEMSEQTEEKLIAAWNRRGGGE